MSDLRDATVIAWPDELRPKSVVPVMEGAAEFGAPTKTTTPQIVVSSAGSWRLIYKDVTVKDTNILRFRAMIARLGGRRLPVYVGPFNHIYRPAKRAAATTPILTTFTSGYTFTGGYKFGSTIKDCTLAAAAKQGDIEIQVTNSATAPLSAGDYFELGGRLHFLEEIKSPNVWTIWPPLRADYASGSKLEIDDPRMLAYLDPASPALKLEMQLAWYGFATFEFYEAPF